MLNAVDDAKDDVAEEATLILVLGRPVTKAELTEMLDGIPEGDKAVVDGYDTLLLLDPITLELPIALEGPIGLELPIALELPVMVDMTYDAVKEDATPTLVLETNVLDANVVEDDESIEEPINMEEKPADGLAEAMLMLVKGT